VRGVGTVMRRVVVLAAVVPLALGLVAPASAQPRGSAIVESDRGPFEYEEINSDLCDFDVEVVGAGRFNFRIREGRGKREQAFFVHNTYSFAETLSANGRSVTVTARQTFNEVQAVPLGGGLFEFTDITAGRFAVRDADGRLLGQEAGVVRSTYTFDTLSDNEPGGEVIGEVTQTQRGRFDDLDSAICAALAP
jgi:hypothetical protein